MRRARYAYSAAHSGLQHLIWRLPTCIGKPSLAPMNITVASGTSFLTCEIDNLPQSTIEVSEMPVPTWASRTTLMPFGVSVRATSASSGCDMESPVTSTVFNGFGGG